MAKSSDQGLSRSHESRTFIRSDEIRVVESSPREPYVSFTIGPHPLRRLVIKIWSHDQGRYDDQQVTDQPHANSDTWFALGIVPTTSDAYLCKIQRNVRASNDTKCHILDWRLNTLFEGDQSHESEAQWWLESISNGSCVDIGVFPLAKGSSSVNVVIRVEVELYDDTNTPQLPQTSPGADEGRRTSTQDPKEAVSRVTSLPERYEQSRSNEDLTRTIEATQQAIETMLDNRPDLAACLSNLRVLFGKRYDVIGLMHDFRRGIGVVEKATRNTSDGQTSPGRYLNNLGQRYYRLYERSRSLDDLTRSIEIWEQAVKVTPDGHSDLPEYLNNLYVSLFFRFERRRSVEDLTRSIEINRKLVEATSDDDPKLAQRLDNLGNSLSVRYREKGRIDDLSCAIGMLDRAVKLGPSGHPKLPGYLGNLGSCLGSRFEATGSMDDLERSIEVTQEAIKSTTSATAHTSLAMYLNNLGLCLGRRYRRRHSGDDLDKAIEVTERAIALIPEKHPYLAATYNNLAMWLSCKPDQNALTRAIEISQKAVAATSEKDLDFAIYSSSLSEVLCKRFEQTGSVDDLTKAIEASQKAVESTPIGHSNLGSLLSNLSNCLGRRHELIGSADDLKRAVEAAERAVEITRHGDTTLASKLSNLGTILASQSYRTGSLHDLARAIKVSEQAVETSDRAGLALCLNNLSYRLSERHRQIGSMEDLIRAIEVAEKAVEAGENDSDIATFLMNLGNRIIELYDRLGSNDDLTRAIEVARKAVRVTHHDHIYLAIHFSDLGNMLGRLYKKTGMKADQDDQLSAYIKSWDAMSSSPTDRMRAAKSAADIHASRQAWDEAYDLLRKAVLLLPKVSPRSLRQSDMQKMLGFTSGLATDAAAMALHARKDVSEVLSVLELGRGVITGLLIDSRGELSDLRKTHPPLADAFDALRQELDTPSQNSGSVAELSTVNRRHEANDELDKVIEQIRAQDGFNGFLQPPPPGDLTAVAESGPIVVINVSKYRCDAILVERHTIRLLEIPSFNFFKDLENMEGSKQNPWPFLEWLWTTLCRPCLDALGFTEPVSDGHWPHVWWVPTGPLSLFPVHAAGIYTVPESKETVLDRVVSSYATSLKALQYGRKRQRGSVDGHEQHNDAVLVAMEETEGQVSLPNARREADKVMSLCPLLNLNSRTPPRRKANILEHLKKCKILHFAGHGRSSRDPSQSCILLDDWKTDPLTVNDLRESWLQKSPAFLAYLSACSTGSNQGQGLWDEAIHLVSAFQVAGFRHVVGTLWEVSDPHCVDVAEVLYQTLCDEGMTDEAVAHGLHRAIRKLRDSCFWEGDKRDIVLVGEDEGKTPLPSVNTFWIPYVHFGA